MSHWKFISRALGVKKKKGKTADEAGRAASLTYPRAPTSSSFAGAHFDLAKREKNRAVCEKLNQARLLNSESLRELQCPLFFSVFPPGSLKSSPESLKEFQRQPHFDLAKKENKLEPYEYKWMQAKSLNWESLPMSSSFFFGFCFGKLKKTELQCPVHLLVLILTWQ